VECDNVDAGERRDRDNRGEHSSWGCGSGGVQRWISRGLDLGSITGIEAEDGGGGKEYKVRVRRLTVKVEELN
jgi:hypothetical protein